jgi:hypothetical protein
VPRARILMICFLYARLSRFQAWRPAWAYINLLEQKGLPSSLRPPACLSSVLRIAFHFNPVNFFIMGWFDSDSDQAQAHDEVHRCRRAPLPARADRYPRPPL